MMMFSIPYDSIYFLFANITFSLLEMWVEIKIDRAAIVLLIVFSFNILIILSLQNSNQTLVGLIVKRTQFLSVLIYYCPLIMSPSPLELHSK